MAAKTKTHTLIIPEGWLAEHVWNQGTGALLHTALEHDLASGLLALQAGGQFAWSDRFSGPFHDGYAETVAIQLANYGALDGLEALLDQGWTADPQTLQRVLSCLLRGERRKVAKQGQVMPLARRLLALGAQPCEGFAGALAWWADLYTHADLALLLPAQVSATTINAVLWNLVSAGAPALPSEEGLIRLLNLLEARGAKATAGDGQDNPYPVHAAAKFNLPKVLAWLLDHGADPTKRLKVLRELRSTVALAPKGADEVRQVLQAWRQRESLKRSVVAAANKEARKRLKARAAVVVPVKRRRL